MNAVALQTILRREVMRFLRIWTQTLLPSPISMTLYFVIFGALIGPKIGQFEGVSFIEYITPGLIMMAVITNSYANVVASFYQAKFMHNIEEMYVSPMSMWVLLSGYILGGVARGVLVGMIVTIVALFFTKVHLLHLFTIFILVILTASLFSFAGLINAIFAKKFDDINIIPTFVLTPLTYLGGVFYSIKILPPFWQVISYFNPIFYIVNAFRYAMLGVSDIGIHIAILLLIIVNGLFLIWSLILLTRGVGIKS